MARDTERIMRSANLSFRTVFANPDTSYHADEHAKPLEQLLESDIEGCLSQLICELVFSAAKCSSDLFAYTLFCAIVLFTAQEEAKRIYASWVNASKTRATASVFPKTVLDIKQRVYGRRRPEGFHTWSTDSTSRLSGGRNRKKWLSDVRR